VRSIRLSLLACDGFTGDLTAGLPPLRASGLRFGITPIALDLIC
jgi:hypothetical protein